MNYNPNATLKDFEEVVKNHKVVIVDFFATWCGPCKVLGPIFEKVAGTTTLPMLKVNVEEVPSLAEKNRVVNIPTVIKFENGVEVKRHVGLLSEEALLDFIK